MTRSQSSPSTRLPWPTAARRAAKQTIHLLLAALLLTSGGCGWWRRSADFFTGWLGADVPRAEMGTAPPDMQLLADDGWSRAAAGHETTPDRPRWRHPRLDELLDRPSHARPDLTRALTDPDSSAEARANAAIGLARWGDGRALEPLLEAARSPQLSMRQRRAAIEALALLEEPPPLPALNELYEQYGRYRPSARSNYLAEMHEELLVALARHVDPAADARFLDALRSPAPEVRLAALHAWRRSESPVASSTDIPLAIADLRGDPDGRIRAAVLGELARRRHPEIHEFCRTGLGDYELVVRLAAIDALGQVGDERARTMLDDILLHQPELMRAAAVRALAAAGDWEAVLQAAADSAWRVRQAVAQSLAGAAPGEGAAVASALVADSSLEVRQAMLASLQRWPIEAAGPLLLDVLESRTYELRKEAAAQLAQRWPPAAAYSVDLPAQRGVEVVAMLRQQWSAQFGELHVDPQVTVAAHHAPIASAVPGSRLDRLAALLAELQANETDEGKWTMRLLAIESQLVDALEQLAVERRQTLPEAVYRNVLPGQSDEFAALEQMQSGDPVLRRRGAARLAEHTAEGPLRPLAVARLAELGIAEGDALVWRSMLQAIEHNSSEPAIRLAMAGMSHPSPEVRRLACVYLGSRADVRHAKALLPALADPHITVVRAAVAGLGRPGALHDAAPLESLLLSNDKSLRVMVAFTLARNGTPSGQAALERLAHDSDEQIRREVADKLGELRDPAQAATLIGMLDDTLAVKRAALAALPQATGQDVPIPPSAPPDARVAAWKEWWNAQGGVYVER